MQQSNRGCRPTSTSRTTGWRSPSDGAISHERQRFPLARRGTSARFGPCALAIGNFDGVHIGHQALLAQTVDHAAKKNLAPAVLTFDPHPAVVVAPERVPAMICTLEQRLRLLSSAGAERILVLPFTAEVARLTPEEFVSQILVDALETQAVFVGENFRFGHKQAGTSRYFAHAWRAIWVRFAILEAGQLSRRDCLEFPDPAVSGFR